MNDVSIIVPIYNMEKYLAKCLDSLCAQDECVKEIIIVNDGSEDGSLEICENYAQNDKRISVINQENKGVSAAIVAGVNAATGAYIGFVDGDDYINSNMYKKMLQEMIKADADVVCCEYERINENGDSLSPAMPDEGTVNVYEKKDGRFPIRVFPLPFSEGLTLSGSRCNKLIKRELIINNIAFNEFNISFGEDLAFVVPIMFSANRIVIIREYLYYYLQRSTSRIHTYNRRCFEDYLKVVQIIDKARVQYDYQMDEFNEFKVKLFFGHCITWLRLSNLKYRERKRELKFYGDNHIVHTLLDDINFQSNLRLKIVMWLLKNRHYGLLALIINKGVRK